MSSRIKFYSVIVFALIALNYLGWHSKAATSSQHTEKVRSYYFSQIDRFDTALSTLDAAFASRTGSADLQQQFCAVRCAYKTIEVFAEYYNGNAVRSLNGAPRPEISSDEQNSAPLDPEGFQVIEPWLFPQVQSERLHDASLQVKGMRQYLKNIRSSVNVSPFSDAHIFDAVRLELFRIISLGITGFDCPVAKNSIAEAAAALRSCKQIVSFYGEGSTNGDSLLTKITAAEAYCNAHNDFNTFDRAAFIRTYANPTCITLAALRTELQIDIPKDKRLVPASAASLFTAALDPSVYAPPYATATNTARIELGKVLFFDPALSANGKRACASCHDPAKAFTDGNTKSTAFDFEGTVDRNSPTIINAALQRDYFYDGRVIFLEDQITAVVTSHKEFRNSFDNIATTLATSSQYRELFAAAFGNTAQVKSEQVRSAIAAYVRSLITLNSPFDTYMRGESTAMNAQEIRGLNLFMGKAQCATCHFAPLFNGTVPPKFEESEWEVLGVPSKADTINISLDPDEGRFALTKTQPIEHHGFKTPTLRNITATAPYMHNGAYSTLEQVLEFYNHGGGAGLGLKVENQTLSSEHLHLSREEMQDIIAFLGTLTDSSYVKMSGPAMLPALSEKTLSHRKIGGVY